MTICKLCGEDKKNLGVHLRHKHDMSKAQYDTIMKDSDNMTNEIGTDVPIPDEVKPQPSTAGTVEGGPKVKVSEGTPEEPEIEITEDTTLGEYCKIKNIELNELNRLVNVSNTGNEESPIEVAQKKVNEGVKESEDLKEQDHVETTELSIAEALVRIHKTHEITSVRSGPPKLYVLKRKGV